MYQIHADIFRQIGLYVKVARQFKQDIKDIKVSNKIVENFGKQYCRVYVEIELRENSSEHCNLQRALWDNISRYGYNEYFSFYLRTGRRDNEFWLRNIEENTHFDYIWNLLAWYLEDDGIKVNPAMFISQQDVEYEREERMKKYEQERKLVDDAIEGLVLQEGQFVAIKEWHGSNLRIGKIKKVVMPNKRQTFSADVLEIKKDLTTGKNPIRLWSMNNIYALIQPEEMQKHKTKPELITSIEQDEKFEGLVWRRPQELW